MIRTEQLNLTVGSFALCDVCLHVQPGEYFVLLGPTGSGKTLLLECLCGLNRVASGTVHIDGVDVTDLEPRLRRVGYVPQDYALFPHRTVRGNIAFGLRDTASPRVAELMEMVGVEGLADRFPAKLSGGEKQRVALARALALDPRVLLLDEPVSAVDEQTRESLCRQLKHLQHATHTTMVHVCHNFTEMLTVADRVGIIDQGRVLQVGTPREVLERPVSSRVARFAQAGNLFPASAMVEKPWLRLDDASGITWRAVLPDLPDGAAAPSDAGGEVIVMIRPENIRLAPETSDRPGPSPSGSEGGTTEVPGVLRDVADLGSIARLRVDCGRLEIVVAVGKREFSRHRMVPGDRVRLSVAAEDIHVMRH